MYMNNLHTTMNEYGLNQGKIFQNYQKDYIGILGKKRLKLINETTMPNIESIEGMENVVSLNDVNNSKNEKIMKLERQFNEKLSNYVSLYKEYIKELSNEDPLIQTFKQKNVKDSAGNYYYVNRYGVARKYSSEAWTNKHSTCPSDVPNDSSIDAFNKMQVGMTLSQGQPCNLDGSLIRNDNGAIDWVTILGDRQHIPTPEILQNVQKNGCPKTWAQISNSIYDMYPAGSNMTSTSNCDTLNLNIQLQDRIISLNDELIHIAQEIYTEVEGMETTGTKLDNEISKNKTKLMSEITKLSQERNKLYEVQQSIDSLHGRYQDNKIMIKSSYYQYMIWLIASITFGAIAIRHMHK